MAEAKQIAARRGAPGAPRGRLGAVQAEIVACERCPRLRAHCTRMAESKVRRFRDHDYWARPVPSFGDAAARLLVVGLAPAAHGANRTGRMFTGDDSGTWLFGALHRAGFASQPTSLARDDGLVLRGAWVTAAAHCAPPDNRPLPAELAACRPYLTREMELLRGVTVVLALGQIAFDAVLAVHGEASPGVAPRRPRPRFGHGAEVRLDSRRTLVASYHPSRQNTQTGRLTRDMLDAVLLRVRELTARGGRGAAAAPRPPA